MVGDIHRTLITRNHLADSSYIRVANGRVPWVRRDKTLRKGSKPISLASWLSLGLEVKNLRTPGVKKWRQGICLEELRRDGLI